MDDEARDFAGRRGVRRVCGAYLDIEEDGPKHRCGRLPDHAGVHQCIKGHGLERGACRVRWQTDDRVPRRPSLPRR